MAKVFFENNFYEAPEGSTPIEFCANCTLQHNTCNGCPWNLVDMEQSKIITDSNIKKEDCLNYVAPPQAGKFYYSRNLRSKPLYNSLLYCEGTPVSNWAHIAWSLVDYAAGKVKSFNDLKSELCTNCEDKKYCKEDKAIDDDGNILDSEYFANCVYHDKHTSIVYNNAHFDKEIPVDVWNACVEIMRYFNNIAYDLIMKNAKYVEHPTMHKKGTFLFNDDKNAPYHDIVNNIFYAETDIIEGMFKNEYHMNGIKFETYSEYGGKESRWHHQIHFKEKPYNYIISEDTVNEVIEFFKEMNTKIEFLIKPYV